MAKKITQKTKTAMPCAEPLERRHTFGEVATGYTDEMAVAEANRCILCKNTPVRRRMPGRNRHSEVRATGRER